MKMPTLSPRVAAMEHEPRLQIGPWAAEKRCLVDDAPDISTVFARTIQRTRVELDAVEVTP